MSKHTKPTRSRNYLTAQCVFLAAFVVGSRGTMAPRPTINKALPSSGPYYVKKHGKTEA